MQANWRHNARAGLANDCLRLPAIAAKGLGIPKSETYIAPGLKPESDGGYPVGAITGSK
jgi:hypothetical protein